jgi:hypothetical protein
MKADRKKQYRQRQEGKRQEGKTQEGNEMIRIYLRAKHSEEK